MYEEQREPIIINSQILVENPTEKYNNITKHYYRKGRSLTFERSQRFGWSN